MIASLVKLQDLFSCRRGAVMILVTFAATVLGMAAVLAIDVARAHLLHGRLQSSVDAALLAVARDPFVNEGLANASVDRAREMFDANFVPGYLDSNVTAFELQSLQQEGNVQQLRLGVSLESVWLLSRLLADTDVGEKLYDLDAFAVAERLIRSTELAMVLDNTGSMNGAKIAELRVAAQTLTDIIFSGQETVPGLVVSVVPYTATVNIGQQHSAWLKENQGEATILSTSDFSPATAWKGCVMARSAPYDQNTATPIASAFDVQFWPSSIEGGKAAEAAGTGIEDPYHAKSKNVWPNTAGGVDERQSARNNGYGPNLGCGPPITPLTASYSEVTAAIADLDAWHRGGTMGNIGLVWGWRALDPDWRGLWRHPDGAVLAEHPFDYTHPHNKKVIVMMTDGQNGWYQNDLTTYGRPDANSLAGESLNDRMATACNNLKDDNKIVVFTITFGGGINDTTKKLYSDCASRSDQDPLFPGPKYFNAPSGDDLRAVFQNIAGQLTELRLIQ